MLASSSICPTLCQQRLFHLASSLLEGNVWIGANDCNVSKNFSPRGLRDPSFRFLECGIFSIHELRFCARKSSYDLSLGKELLSVCAHRIVASVEIPLTSS